MVFVVRNLLSGEGFQQRSVTGSKARKEDRSRSIGNGFAIFRLAKPVIHLRFDVCELVTGNFFVVRYPQKGPGPSLRSELKW